MTTETNVKRLERISKTDRYMYDRSGKRVTVSAQDFDFLIQQAELAEKLAKLEDAKFRFYNNGFEEDRWALQEENIRLREALEFYADDENYEIGFSYVPQMTIDCMVIDDGGHAARRALKGESE